MGTLDMTDRSPHRKRDISARENIQVYQNVLLLYVIFAVDFRHYKWVYNSELDFGSADAQCLFGQCRPILWRGGDGGQVFCADGSGRRLPGRWSRPAQLAPTAGCGGEP